MDIKRKRSCESKAKIFKALAHPTRIFILEELAKKNKCVCEITTLVGCDVTTVSKNLSLMKDAGIIGSYNEINKVFYFLERPCALKFLKFVNEVEYIKLKAFKAV